MKSLELKELQVELTYNSLFNYIYNSGEKAMEEAIERYNHYKRLGIESMQTAKNAVMATWLHNREMSLIHKEIDQSWGIGHFQNDGGMVEEDGRWLTTTLKKFTGGIPIELLRRLPNNAGEKAVVFYKAVDPILAYPLMYKCVVLDRAINPRWYNKKWVNTPGHPGPYFIAVHRWE